jgi:hypothetical protein
MALSCQTRLGRLQTGYLLLVSTFPKAEAHQLLSASVRPMVLLRAHSRRIVDSAHLLAVAVAEHLNLLVGDSASSSESRGRCKMIRIHHMMIKVWLQYYSRLDL